MTLYPIFIQLKYFYLIYKKKIGENSISTPTSIKKKTLNHNKWGKLLI